MANPASETNHLSIPKFTKRVLIVLGISALGFLLFVLVKSIVHILLLLFASVLFAVFLLELSRALSRKIHIKTNYCLALVMLGILILTGLTIWYVGPRIAAQVNQLSQQLPHSVEQAKDQLSQYNWGEQLVDQLPDKINWGDRIGQYSSKVFSFLSSTLGILADFLIFLAFSLFIASSPKLYTQGILHLVPHKKRKRTDEVLNALRFTLFRWLSGRLIDMLIVGVATGIGLWILGVPLALTMGLLAAILNFIPNIGPVLAAIPPVLLALSQSQSLALYVILLFIGIQLLESYFLTPKIQKKAVSMPPVMLITAQLAIAKILGFLGLTLATPIMASIMVVVKMLYVEDVLQDHSIKVKGEEKT